MKFPSLPRQTIQCTCGKVQLAIESPSALRLVCYCRDCRGYYQTLNANNATAAAATATSGSHNNHSSSSSSSSSRPSTTGNAKLDRWGGLDGTQIYPNEMKVIKGEEFLTKCMIRIGSPIQRVYTTCCYTPIFTMGNSGAAILNTHLLQDPLPDVQFRIVGRQALTAVDDDDHDHRPAMSWSVPLSWFWTMPGRIQKEKSSPAPLEGVQAQVLENFQEG